MKAWIFLKKYYRNNSLVLLLSVVLFSSSIFIFYTITDEIVLENETDFDQYIFSFFKEFIVTQRLNDTVKIITDFAGSSFIKYIFPSIVLLLFIFKQKRKSIFLFVTGSGGLLLLFAFKNIFERARPPYPLLYQETGFSFPSGHATFSFIFYGALAYLLWLTDLPKFFKILMMGFLVLLSIAIGISRIYLRVHFPSDVLAGFCLGYSWLLLIIYAFRRWYPVN